MKRSFFAVVTSAVGLLVHVAAADPAPGDTNSSVLPDESNTGGAPASEQRTVEVPFVPEIQGRVQARFSYEAVDGTSDEYQFSIPRARLTLKGRAYDDHLKYAAQVDFGKGSASLKDFFVDYAFLPEALHLKVGQFKRPFSRQQLTSSGKQELVDRAITDKAFGAGRDIGLMIHDDIGKSPRFEYALGVFNGTGDKAQFSGDVLVDPTTGEGSVTSGSFTNVPKRAHPMVVGRLGYNNANGGKGYSEADLERGPFRWGLGISVSLDGDTDGGDDSRAAVQADYYLKAQGFSATGGAYLSSTQAGSSTTDHDWEALGWHVQGGYVIARKVQPVLRYAVLRPRGDDHDVEELRGGVAIYFRGHDLKWQSDGGVIVEDAESDYVVTPVFRTQLQLCF